MKNIRVIVKGGTVVDVKNVPSCCGLNVYDYDVAGGDFVDNLSVEHDEDGLPCYIYEW